MRMGAARALLYLTAVHVMCLALAWPAFAQPGLITLDRLEALLVLSSREPVRYQETTESAWLQTAEHSYGMMYWLPDALEKRVEHPRQEVWRVYADRIVRVVSESGETKELVLGASGRTAVFANALRSILTGKLRGLESAFTWSLKGHELDWAIRFKPRSADDQQYFEWIEARGNGSALHEVHIQGAGGDRGTIRFAVSEE